MMMTSSTGMRFLPEQTSCFGGDCRRVGVCLRDDHRRRPLAQRRIGKPQEGRLPHARDSLQNDLGADGKHVLPAPDDYIVDAPNEVQEALLVDPRQVPCTMPDAPVIVHDLGAPERVLVVVVVTQT